MQWPAGAGAGARAGAGRGGGGELIDSRPRDTVSLSSHRCPFAGPTKKEIGFAEFDPFVFGHGPAWRAGAEKCEGPLIGRRGPAPPPPAQPPAQFKGGCRADCLGCLFGKSPISIGYLVSGEAGLMMFEWLFHVFQEAEKLQIILVIQIFNFILIIFTNLYNHTIISKGSIKYILIVWTKLATEPLVLILNLLPVGNNHCLNAMKIQ